MWTSHIQDYKDIFLQTKVCAFWAKKSGLRYYLSPRIYLFILLCQENRGRLNINCLSGWKMKIVIDIKYNKGILKTIIISK